VFLFIRHLSCIAMQEMTMARTLILVFHPDLTLSRANAALVRLLQ
jgi:hypothetical protein